MVKTALETYDKLKTDFGEDASAKTQTNEWFWRFKDRDTSVENKHRVRPRQEHTHHFLQVWRGRESKMHHPRSSCLSRALHKYIVTHTGKYLLKDSRGITKWGTVFCHDNTPVYIVRLWNTSSSHSLYTSGLVHCNFLFPRRN
jgi:hypothetical protein